MPGNNPGQGRKPFVIWIYPLAWIVLLVGLIYFFSAVSTVILGILAATIIACTLYPLLDKIPGPRGLQVAAVGLGLLVGVGGITVALSWPLARPIQQAAEKWPAKQQVVDAFLQEWSDRLGLKEDVTVPKLMEGLGDFLTTGQAGRQLFSQSADVALGILLSLLFALVGSIFLISEPPERLLNPALRLFSDAQRPIMQAALADLAPRYRRWVIGTITGMCVVFTASLIGYTAIGLQLALPLALLAGFAEIVPTVGPAIACAIALLFAAALETGAKAAGVLVVYGAIQAIEAYVILPLIMRGAVNIHPAVTLFTVILWGKIFGVPGLMLAIPINLTIWTFVEHFRIRPREREEQGHDSGTAPQPERSTPVARE